MTFVFLQRNKYLEKVPYIRHYVLFEKIIIYGIIDKNSW